MFLLRHPTEQDILDFLSRQRNLSFSYEAVGATATIPPANFVLDHNRIRLGQGETVYRRAVAALENWQQFELGWVKALPEHVPIRVGSVVAVQARAYNWWSLNACRIVYVIDEKNSSMCRFGFAYGTLPDHVERGEERFMIERTEDDAVWYDILAFSQVQHRLVRFAYPLARRLQKRFAQDSMKKMCTVAGVGERDT